MHLEQMLTMPTNSDSFSRREAANEAVYIKQQEQEKYVQSNPI